MIMQQTHELLDSIERKVQSCINREKLQPKQQESLDKLLFSNRPSLNTTIEKKNGGQESSFNAGTSKAVNSKQIKIPDFQTQRLSNRVSNTNTIYINEIQNERISQPERRSSLIHQDFPRATVHNDNRTIANLNRTIKLYQLQVSQLQEQMKKMQQNYTKQIQELRSQIRKYQ